MLKSISTNLLGRSHICPPPNFLRLNCSRGSSCGSRIENSVAVNHLFPQTLRHDYTLCLSKHTHIFKPARNHFLPQTSWFWGDNYKSRQIRCSRNQNKDFLFSSHRQSAAQSSAGRRATKTTESNRYVGRERGRRDETWTGWKIRKLDMWEQREGGRGDARRGEITMGLEVWLSK